MEKESQKPIQFKPLTEGLGFHPFADGLPYAPPTKGAGAISAGRPQFNFPEQKQVLKPQTATPPKPQPQFSSSAASAVSLDPAIEKIKRELQAIQKQKVSAAQKTATAFAAPAIPNFGFGYLFVRLFAYTIDTAFNLSLFGSILSTALLSEDFEAVLISRPGAFILMGFFLIICNWLSITGQEIAFGTSLGKRVFGLKLLGTGTDAFVRALFFIPSAVFSGIGIFICIFDRKKRCWHDRASGLQPTYL